MIKWDRKVWSNVIIAIENLMIKQLKNISRFVKKNLWLNNLKIKNQINPLINGPKKKCDSLNHLDFCVY